ncbi:hypothetical protein ASD65_10700 [Microbacterium sp. Root61]|uniref:GNAT family N-acetyltransferase n=1 Tax=Microbacterium sp. Root61 TaxID=1736570 RepID=UPI0006FAD479|nr:GNAT family N-acetyltransferase [Microbacterium sp. Root61]KRA24841.1 hypothetical protein ASD65_10700 [Microbacterium sp. Root61]
MSEADSVDVVRGIPDGSRAEVARLYWEAFGRKLSPSLGDREHGESYIESQLNADGFFCATISGRVIGVLGFHDSSRAAVGFSYRRLVQEYSMVSAPWRTALLMILGRRPRAGELLLDGLSVASQSRGLGVGSRLLGEAIIMAESQGMKQVRLSVVDSNPRARALYERLGFRAVKTESIGLPQNVFGFQRATEMVFRISERAQG